MMLQSDEPRHRAQDLKPNLLKQKKRAGAFPALFRPS